MTVVSTARNARNEINRSRVKRGVTQRIKIIPQRDNKGCPQPARNLIPKIAESKIVRKNGPNPINSKNVLSNVVTGGSFVKMGFLPNNKIEKSRIAGNNTSICCQANCNGKFK